MVFAQTVMSNFREESTSTGEMLEEMDESMRGYDDPDWELWEEWMGWEGAGIRDYSSHINPYIWKINTRIPTYLDQLSICIYWELEMVF